MSLDWLFNLRKERAQRRARERIEARIAASESVRLACRKELDALTGIEPDAEGRAKLLCREIAKREHRLRCLRAELDSIKP